MLREALKTGQTCTVESLVKSECRSSLQQISKVSFVWEFLHSGRMPLPLAITSVSLRTFFYYFFEKAHVLHIMHIH